MNASTPLKPMAVVGDDGGVPWQYSCVRIGTAARRHPRRAVLVLAAIVVLLLVLLGMKSSAEPSLRRQTTDAMNEASIALDHVREPTAPGIRHRGSRITAAVVEQDLGTLQELVRAEKTVESAMESALRESTGRGRARVNRLSALTVETDLAVEKAKLETAIEATSRRVEQDVAALHHHPLLLKGGVPMSSANKALDVLAKEIVADAREQDRAFERGVQLGIGASAGRQRRDARWGATFSEVGALQAVQDADVAALAKAARSYVPLGS